MPIKRKLPEDNSSKDQVPGHWYPKEFREVVQEFLAMDMSKFDPPLLQLIQEICQDLLHDQEREQILSLELHIELVKMCDYMDLKIENQHKSGVLYPYEELKKRKLA